MKRKLISMICALSMVFSVVSGFSLISAQADGTATVSTEATVDGSNLVVTISYSGVTGGFAFAQVKIPADDTIDTTAKGTYKLSDALDELGATMQTKKWVTDGDSTYFNLVISYADGKTATAPESGELATLTFPLKSADAYPEKVTYNSIELQGYDAEGNTPSFTTAAGTITAPEATVTNGSATAAPTTSAAATATPRPTINPSARPTKAPVATDAPDVTAAPVFDANIATEAEVVDGNLVVKISYTGATGGFAFTQLKIAADASMDTTTNGKFALSDALDEIGATAQTKKWVTDGDSTYFNLVISYADGGTTAAPESGEIGTLTLPLASTVTYPITISYVSGEMQGYDKAGNTPSFKTADNTLSANSITVADPTAPTATPVPTVAPGTDVDVKDAVGSDNASDINDNTTDEIGLNVTFKDSDGNEVDAEYGEDYVVVDGDGNALTADEWANIVNGYDTEGLKNLLNNGGKFVIYNDDIASIATDVIDYTTNDYIGDTTDTTVSTSPTAKPTATPKATWTWNVTSVKVDSSVALDTVYTDADGVSHSDDEITYSMKSTSTCATLSKKGILTGKKKGSVSITATYTDDDGNEITDTHTITVKDTSSGSSSGSSSDSSSSGGGDVASGNNSNTPTINNEIYFTDLYNVPWAETAINGLASKGVVNGKSEHLFDPEANVTRAEFAKMLVSTFGFTQFTGAASEFADVPESHWAYQYVSIAYTLGAITGYDSTTFGPDDNITRQDMAVMIYRLVTKYNFSLDLTESAITFTDNDQIASYAAEAVSTLQQADVINGMGDGTFAPNDNATRAQAAVMLYNFIK